MNLRINVKDDRKAVFMFYKLDNDYIKFCNDDNPWIEINNEDDIGSYVIADGLKWRFAKEK